MGGQLAGPVGGEGDAVLSRLALGRHPDDHEIDATVRPAVHRLEGTLTDRPLTGEAPVPIFRGKLFSIRIWCSIYRTPRVTWGWV